MPRQRLGMSFGGDTNAYTSFDHTAYEIELPDTKPAMVAEGLQVFADMAGTLLLRPDQIAKERPIILSEKRDRDSVDYREFVASFQFAISVSGPAFGAQNEAGGRQLAVVETAMRRQLRAHNSIGAALMIDQTVWTKLGNGKKSWSLQDRRPFRRGDECIEWQTREVVAR